MEKNYSILTPLLNSGSDSESQTKLPVVTEDSLQTPSSTNSRVKWLVWSLCGISVLYTVFLGSQIDLPYSIQIVRKVTVEQEVSQEINQNTTTTGRIFTVHKAVTDRHAVPDGYLVWSPSCKIPNPDPMVKEVMQFYHREKGVSCSLDSPLTTVDWDSLADRFILKVFNEARPTYHFQEGHCQYQKIIRDGEETQSKSPGVNFTSTTVLSLDAEFVYVECFRSSDQESVYKDVHFVVQRKPEVLKRLQKLTVDTEGQLPKKVPSVLLFGIDSISRSNLLRAMPNTANHLMDNGWFDMKGYNKVGDNTFPNLMAALTGFNLSWAEEECKPRRKHGLEKCPIIWKDFSNAGFVTGYAEDEPWMSTFNYLKKGFASPPTDFYARPGMLAASELEQVEREGLALCMGDRMSSDYVYKYGLDVAERFREEGSFGLYWANSFSHNEVNTPSMMDARIKLYLEEMDERGVLNDTIVFFFADHGMRFGPVRRLMLGWLEERLPFLFIWLPPWFQKRHPDIVRALRINQNRLTNPYDLFLTLKHIVRLSGRATMEPGLDKAMGCAKCQSMFQEVPWNRSCPDIGIDDHWCTCVPYTPEDAKSKNVKRAAQYVIEYLNQDIIDTLNGTTRDNGESLCATLALRKVVFAGSTKNVDDEGYEHILIQFKTKPGKGYYESTVRYSNVTEEYKIAGVISRLDEYGDNPKCVHDKHVEMYCECLGGNK